MRRLVAVFLAAEHLSKTRPRLHFGFGWRGYDDASLKRRKSPTPPAKLIDPAMFSAVRPYLARPDFVAHSPIRCFGVPVCVAVSTMGSSCHPDRVRTRARVRGRGQPHMPGHSVEHYLGHQPDQYARRRQIGDRHRDQWFRRRLQRVERPIRKAIRTVDRASISLKTTSTDA
jgi:hypothetical protein